MFTIDIITIFPNTFASVLNESILKRAQEKKKVKIRVHDLRDYTVDKKHRKVDDRPFGGGPGMVLSPQPIFDAVSKIKKNKKAHVVFFTPSGETLTQKLAKNLSGHQHLILICGHYEGIDERVREKLANQCICIGDYVLTGGEIPAMVLVDCVTRLIPGVLGKQESLDRESFEENLLEYPQYTRPSNFRGMKVPNVLLSGNHKAIEKWRQQEALKKTKKFRPDLLKKIQKR